MVSVLQKTLKKLIKLVLILISVEDGFCEDVQALYEQNGVNVLILISVEDGFCVIIAPKQTIKNKVLILISVEDGFCAIKNI